MGLRVVGSHRPKQWRLRVKDRVRVPPRPRRGPGPTTLQPLLFAFAVSLELESALNSFLLNGTSRSTRRTCERGAFSRSSASSSATASRSSHPQKWRCH